jgi:hypothetical protein
LGAQWGRLNADGGVFCAAGGATLSVPVTGPVEGTTLKWDGSSALVDDKDAVKSSTRNYFGAALFAIGAIASIAWAYRITRDVLEMFEGASGGIGAVSFGLVQEVAFYAVALGAHWSLAGWLRRQGRAGVTLKRIHLIVTLAMPAATVAMTLWMARTIVIPAVESALPPESYRSAVIVLFLLGGLALPVQAFFAAAFLGLWVGSRQKRP